MATRCTVHLVRHGESLGNVDPTRARSEDPPLTARGRDQAARAAEALRGAQLDALFTSPLRRARETAQAVARAAGLEVRDAPGFQEVDMGRLADAATAGARAEREAIFSAWLAGDRSRAFPGGEDFAAVVRRVEAGLRQLAEAAGEGARLAVVTHRMPIAAAAALCAPGDVPVPAGGCANGSVTTLRRDGGRWQLVAWGAEAPPPARGGASSGDPEPDTV